MRQFRIDDSERNRILNLHENATKRQYLSEQGNNCIPINEVNGISEFVDGDFNLLTNIMVQEISEVCRSNSFGDIAEYTFTMESNNNLTVESFKIDGDLTPKESGS